MLIVLFILGLIMIGISIKLYRSYVGFAEDFGAVLGVISGVLLSIVMIAIVVSFVVVHSGMSADAKIMMYQEENKQIEKDIDIIVDNYLQHEEQVFNNVNVENPTLCLQMYPNLKSDKMIINQMKIYTSNNKQIKKLKNTKYNAEVAKWWLYFGGDL